MRLPLLHREQPPALPGVSGQVRLDPSTRVLLRRLRPGDIALVDEVDLDQLTAEGLVAARVVAVVNASPSISGRYPAQGARLLLAAGIPLLDDVGAEVVGRVTDGDLVRVDGDRLLVGQRVLGEGTALSTDGVDAALREAEDGLRAQLEAFAGGAPEFLRTEQALVLDGEGIPDVETAFEGRPALVVARGPRDRADLAAVHDWIQDQHPTLVGVGAGADVLLDAGYRPDLVLGDMDEVSDEALDCGAELVVHALRDGRAAGLERARQHHTSPTTFTSDATSEDLAVLLAVQAGASVVVTAGTADGLVELLDRDRAGMPSTVLTRLRVGDRLVDARSVAVLHRREVSWVQVLLLLLAGVVAVSVAVVTTPIGQDWIDRLGGLVISFRYHLVSLAAVLLGLAAGVVLGAGPLDGRLGSTGTAASQEETASLKAQVAEQQQRIGYDDAVATALTPAVIPHRLKGRSVVIVVAPDTDRAQVQQLTQAVRDAGGTVTGEVDIQPAWVDPAQATVLGTLADQLVPKDVTLPNGGPYVRAGAALATALVTDTPTSGGGAADEDALSILTGFEEGGFVTVHGDPAVGAGLALVAAPPAPPGRDDAAIAAADALLPLVAALDSGQGAVLGGAEGSVRPGGLVGALRDSGAVRRAVSSVDVADLPSGVLSSVLALAEQAAGSSGQYGIGPGADAAMPEVGPAR